MIIAPPVLLRYRLAVARIGERDIFHWWDSNALTEEGQYALGRLLRKTAKWAGIELALEAARLRHQALVPSGTRLTLFDLGSEMEESFNSWLRRVKTENRLDAIKLPVVPTEARSTVAEAFRALDLFTEELKPKEMGDRNVHVGRVDSSDLNVDAVPIVKLLLAGYLKSGKDRFLAPYVTLEAVRS